MHLRTAIVFLVVLFEDTTQTLDLDTKDGRCGKNLIDTLNKYCYAFYNFEGAKRDVNSYNDDDNIVNLCCNNPCTIRELIRDYCAEIREEYKPDFAAPPPPKPLPLVQEKDEKTNAIVQESSVEQQDAQKVVESNTTPKMNSALLKAIEQNVHKKPSRPARIGYANVRRQNYILVDESIPHLSQEIQFESLHSCLFGC